MTVIVIVIVIVIIIIIILLYRGIYKGESGDSLGDYRVERVDDALRAWLCSDCWS